MSAGAGVPPKDSTGERSCGVVPGGLEQGPQLLVGCWLEATLIPCRVVSPAWQLLHQRDHEEGLPARDEPQLRVIYSQKGPPSLLSHFIGWKQVTGLTQPQKEEIPKKSEHQEVEIIGDMLGSPATNVF